MGVWIETYFTRTAPLETAVTPFVGVWIETVYVPPVGEELQVTPFVGVWIETIWRFRRVGRIMSHPSWVCGLKLPSPHAYRIRM